MRDRSSGDGSVAARGGRTFRGEREFGDKVGAALARKQERFAETPRREHFPPGGARGADTGSDCRTVGPDFDGERCSAAQAADSNQPQLALAFSRSTRHHPQKKVCKLPNGTEQMWRRHADVGYESKVCLTPPGWCSSTRLRSAPTWRGSGGVPQGASG